MLEDQISRTPGWRIEETAHYFIVTNIEDKRFIRELQERAEAIRREFKTFFPHPDLDPVLYRPPPMVIRVCASREQFHSYGGPLNSAGYWNSNSEEIVLFDDRHGPDHKNTWVTLQSLVFLEYAWELHGEPAFPPWFLQGHGDFYAGFMLDANEKRLVPQPFSWRLPTIQSMIGKGKFVPLKELVRFDQREYYGQNARGAPSGENFAEGWSLVWFLRTGAGKAPGWSPAWETILPTYLRAWLETHDREAAAEKAFAAVDWAALERSWSARVASL